jgi:CRP-like cAMP-binding protein
MPNRGVMKSSARAGTGNHLLANLSRGDRERIASHLVPVSLALGEVLYEPGAVIRQCYFPNDGVVSLLTVLGPHKAAEVGMVGSEGLVGTSAAVGIQVSQLRAVVQGAGSAMRMTAASLRKEFEASRTLQRGVLRFMHALMGQMAQTAVCNRFHTADMRLARWLLATRDRLRSDSFQLTHQFLSMMIGVRRVGVTQAAGNFASRNLISYRRGNIRILNVKGLQAASCECYEVVRAMYETNAAS